VPILVLLFAGGLAAQDISSWELYQAGREAEKQGRMAQAYLLYSEAAALDPRNRTYWLHSQAVQARAGLETRTVPVLSPQVGDGRWNGGPALEEATAQDLAEAGRPLPPSDLEGAALLQSFDLQGDSKKLYTDVAKAFGLDCVFDADYQAMPSLRFRLENVGYREALHGLELATGTFVVPVSAKLFLVAADTPLKRTQNEPVVVVTLPLADAGVQQDFTSLMQAVQQATAIEKASYDSLTRTLVLRDRLSRVLPARALLEQLLYPRAQLMMDLELVEISGNRTSTYGVDFPTLFSLTPLTTWLQNQINLPTSVSGLLSFGGGKTLLGLGIMNAAAVAQMSESEGKVLWATELRGEERQPASLHVGNRYPVLTAGYFGSTGSALTPGTATPGTATTPSGTGSGAGTVASGVGSLTLSAASVAWTYQPGGVVPQDASISVTSSNGAIDFTATVTSSSPWLTVDGATTAAGTLPATLTISPGAALATLAGGNYVGTVQVSGADGSVTYITVTLAVNGATGNVSISPSTIALAAEAGGLTAEQTVTVTSSVAGAFSASVAGPGLTVSLLSTTAGPGAPATLTVSGNPTGLSALTYLGILSVTVGDVTEETTVTFSVTSSGSLQLSQAAIPWTYSSGGSLPTATTVAVSGTGTATSFTATASSASSWLLVNGAAAISATLPASLVLSPSDALADLSTGTYTGTVQLNASDGSVAYINVTLTVNGGTTSGLAVSPNPISLSAQLQGSLVQQTITVTSETAGDLSASVTGSGLSISAVPSSVEAGVAATFVLNANPVNLAANTYVGSLTVTVGGATQTVAVNFSVGAISSGSNGTSAYEPVPSFDYEDLGLSLKLTPAVHGMAEVSLEIEAEVKLLTGQSVNGVPVISNRSLKSTTRLENGEWAAIAGLLDTNEARNIAGLAGLSEIPYLGPLVSTHERDTSRDRVILLVRPRLLSIPPGEHIADPIPLGTDSRPATMF